MNTIVTSSTPVADGSDLPGTPFSESPDCNTEFEMTDSTMTTARETTIGRHLRDLEQALNNLKVTLLSDCQNSKRDFPSTSTNAGYSPLEFSPSWNTHPDLPIPLPNGAEPPIEEHTLGLSNSNSMQSESASVETSSLTEFQLQRTKDKLKEAQQELRVALSRIHTLTQTCAELKIENQEKADTILTITHELREYKLNSLNSVGNVILLAKPDELSGTDIKERVVALNDLIFQTATYIRSTLIHHKWESDADSLNAAYTDACRTVGRSFTRALTKESRKPQTDGKIMNPFLPQVVLESLLVQFCALKIGLWFPDTQEISNIIKTRICDPIREAEKQAVFGAWRAFTLSHIRPATTTWRDDFMISLTSLLRLANWQVHSPTNLASVESKLAILFETMRGLRVVIGEKVTSVDLELNVVPEGAGFDRRWMVDGHDISSDADKNSSQRTKEIVIATTGLGLKTSVPSSGEKRRFRNLLPPKVVLKSTLEDTVLQKVVAG